MTTFDEKKFYANGAIKDAADLIEQMATELERGAKELRRYKAQLIEGKKNGSTSTRSDVLGYAVWMNTTRSARLDLVPDRAAKLALFANE